MLRQFATTLGGQPKLPKVRVVVKAQTTLLRFVVGLQLSICCGFVLNTSLLEFLQLIFRLICSASKILFQNARRPADLNLGLPPMYDGVK